MTNLTLNEAVQNLKQKQTEMVKSHYVIQEDMKDDSRDQ